MHLDPKDFDPSGKRGRRESILCDAPTLGHVPFRALKVERVSRCRETEHVGRRCPGGECASLEDVGGQVEEREEVGERVSLDGGGDSLCLR